MENEIHLTLTADLPYHISFKPLEQFDIWNTQTDRQTIYPLFSHFEHCQKRIHTNGNAAPRDYILMETLTSPLPTKSPERVILAS